MPRRFLYLPPEDASLLEDVIAYYESSRYGGQTAYGPGEDEPAEQVEHRRDVRRLAERVSEIHDYYTRLV